jgi:multiple sugar transport system permease protein
VPAPHNHEKRWLWGAWTLHRSKGLRRRPSGRGTAEPRLAPFGFAGPALVLLTLVYAVPSALDGFFSLTSDHLGGGGRFVGLANYASLGSDGLFWQSAENTILFAVITVGGGTVLALGVALLLSGSFVGKGIYRFFIYLPQSISFASGAVIWTWLFNAQDGPIDIALRRLGLPGPSWLTDPHLALLSIVIMSWWRDIGFYMVVLVAAIEAVPQLLVEAARVDGASRARVFWHVTLPSVRPAMLFVVLTWSLGALQMFTQSYIMTNGGPVEATYTIVLKIYNDAFQSLNLGLAAAEAFVLLAVCMVVGVLAVRWFSRGLQQA